MEICVKMNLSESIVVCNVLSEYSNKEGENELNRLIARKLIQRIHNEADKEFRNREMQANENAI